jgi:nucleotide sugar dehydrogenase
MSYTKTVGVVGVGFVGLHLVEVFSEKFNVVGYDVSEKRVEYLKGLHFIKDAPNVTLVTSPESLATCDMICISVPTLVNADETINDTYVKAAVETVERLAKDGAVIVMESSVHVGMTRKLMAPLHEVKGLYIGFSPERVDPGCVDPPCKDIPKIISGIDDVSLMKVEEFYGQVFTTTVKVSSMETAEMCKLYENCFRMINIAYANEAADACGEHGIDVKEMIAACSTKPFGFMPFSSGLGVGGYCIPVNPFYLAVNCDFPLLQMATKTTLARPVQKAQELVDKYENVHNVMVVGVAFKPGESITVNSPGATFATVLKDAHGKNVCVLDPLADATDPTFQYVSMDETVEKIKKKEIDIVCVAMKQWDVDLEMLERVCNESGVEYVAFV